MVDQINADVSLGQDFFAEQVSVSHSPIRFVIDFARNTPRIDAAAQATRLLTSHSIIMIDPYLAKEFVSVLSDNIDRYEKKFGIINKPEALQKFEKNAHRHGKKPLKQDYFG